MNDEPTRLQKKALAFFRATRGVQSLSLICAEAAQIYPTLTPERALEAYFRSCETAYREVAAASDCDNDGEMSAAVDQTVALQFG
jgi:hypothetical protein